MSADNFKLAYRISLGFLCAGLLAVSLAPGLHADTWNKQTKFTFAEPVQVPGRVLPAGTYVFRLLDSASDRHVVQIFDENNQRLITTVLAIPNYRMQPTGHTVVKFDERRIGTPEALKAWFYPGDNFGQEFVYRKGESLEMAAVTTTPVATETTTEIAQTVPAEEPKPATVETETTPAAEPAPASPFVEETPDAGLADQNPTPAASEPVKTETAPAEPEKLPKTGSELPLMGLLSLASLGSGLAIRKLRSKV